MIKQLSFQFDLLRDILTIKAYLSLKKKEVNIGLYSFSLVFTAEAICYLNAIHQNLVLTTWTTLLFSISSLSFYISDFSNGPDDVAHK